MPVTKGISIGIVGSEAAKFTPETEAQTNQEACIS